MVRPKFVKAAVKDGEVVKEYPTEVINPKICSDHTLTQIREILRKVVSQGLAKPAGSKQFSVFGCFRGEISAETYKVVHPSRLISGGSL